MWRSAMGCIVILALSLLVAPLMSESGCMGWRGPGQ